MSCVFIATLNYSGTIQPATEQALERSYELFRGAGWQVVSKIRAGDSVLPRARNAMLSEFLATPADTMICLDDDISWDAGEMLALAQHPGDVVAGCYRMKMDEPTFPVMWNPENAELWAENGLLEVWGVPAGFMKLKRGLVERLTMLRPDLQYDEPTVPGGKAWCLFNHELRDNRLWGEDYIFNRYVREAGGRIWVDPEMLLHHHGRDKAGEPKVYSGRLGDWLRARIQKEAA